MEVAQFGVRRLLDADVLDNPFATYRIMRERDPVAWDSDLQAWVVTGYPESVAVLRDTESFCSDFRRLGESTPTSMLSIQSLDPPEHAAIRGLMVEAVRAVDGEDLARLVAETVAEQLDVVTGVGTFDFVGMFAEPVALRVITGVLGVPAPDPEWFTPVSHAVVDAMDGTLRPECVEAGLAARTELAALAGDWLDSPPELGLIAHVAGSARRGGVERDVLLNTLRAVLHAGFESAGQKQAILVYFNAEMIASPNFVRFVMRGPGVLSEPFAEYYTAHHMAFELVGSDAVGSDHEPFAAAGITVGGILGGAMGVKTAAEAATYGGTAGQMYDPCYHQPCDTLANLNQVALDQGARAMAYAVGWAADGTGRSPR